MSADQQTSRQTLTLEGGKPWGFRIVGGADMNVPLKVQQVLSARAKESGLVKEDRILEINGKSTGALTHNEIKNLIVQSGTTLKLVIERTTSGDNQSSRGMSSAPSKSPTVSNSTENITLGKSPPNEQTKKPDIKPKVSLGDEKTEKPVESPKLIGAGEPNQHVDQNKCSRISEDSGLAHSSEIKSPYLKRIIEAGGSYPTQEDPVMNVKPPTATYSPPKSTTSDTAPKTTPSNTNQNNDLKKNMQDDDKVCAGCNQLIKDSSYISASEKYYHKLHFCCSHCGNTLVGKAYFEDKDNKVCCQQCISKGGGDCCKACSKPIHGSFLTVGKDCYHDVCFTCADCKKSLKSEPFIFADGKPKCERCYEETNSSYCIKCHKPIKAGESFVEVESGNCHSKCFTCKICKSVLTSFKMRDGYAICPKH